MSSSDLDRETVLASDGERGRLIGRAVYFSVLESLYDDGVTELAAHRIALRAARGVVLRTIGFQAVEFAPWLGVTPRTVKRDARQVRQLDGKIADAMSRPLPRVPVKPEEIVRPAMSPPADSSVELM